MDEKVFEQFCYDFYGELLSERQKMILDYYYNEDYSISEIGELIGLTRQGVSDACKRARKQMQDYEDKLGLVSRYLEMRRLLKDFNKEMASLLSDTRIGDEPDLETKLMGLKQRIDKIIEGI